MPFYGVCFHQHFFNVQIDEGGLVNPSAFTQADRDLVDYAVRAFFFYLRFDNLSLIPVHKVFGNDIADGFHALFYGFFVIGGAILAEKIFQNIGRDNGVAFDQFGQVFPDNLSGKYLVEFFIQSFHNQKSSKSFVNEMLRV